MEFDSPPRHKQTLKKRNDMTEIVAFDRNGKIVFRSVVKGLLTQAQVDKELKEWCVNKDAQRVQIIYDK